MSAHTFNTLRLFGEHLSQGETVVMQRQSASSYFYKPFCLGTNVTEWYKIVKMFCLGSNLLWDKKMFQNSCVQFLALDILSTVSEFLWDQHSVQSWLPFDSIEPRV